MGINAAYSAYKGAEAIKHGDLLGGALSIAGAFAGGAANAFSGAAARTAANVANGINVASQGVDTARALKEGDMFGALAGGLGTAAMMGGGRNFQVAAGGVKTTQSLAEGDFLGAGAGFTGVVGNLSRPGQDPGMNAQQAQHTDTSFAFSTLSDGLNVVDGIQEGNFAQIGKGLAGGIKGIGDQIDAKQSLADTKPLDQGDEGVTNAGAATNANGERETVIRQAGFTKPNATPAQSVEVAGGDTLSRIATRHGTSVDALMAANPEIADPNRIHAGQELSLPEGVRSVEMDRQARLAEFGEVNGGGAPILPSPARPSLGDPTLQPGATHPNAGGNVSGARPLDGNEMIAGAEEEVIENFREDIEGWRALSKEAGDALDDLVGAAQHMTAATPTDETQADYDDTRARGQALVEKGEAAVDAIKETLAGSEEPIAKPAADAIEHLTNAIKEFNENIRAGNSREVGAGIGDGVSAIIGAVSDVTRGALNIFVPRTPGVDVGRIAESGTIKETGASRILDARDPEAWEAAETAYDAIRQTDDVGIIAKNTGWPASRVERVKHHLFEAIHQLDWGPKKFDAHPSIANAWHRLQSGTQNANDMRLLEHELFESKFEGIFKTDYRTAHEAAVKSGRIWEEGK